MKIHLTLLIVALAAGIYTGCGAGASSQPFTANLLDIEVGGQPAVELVSPPLTDESRPALLSAVLLPGRGMNTFQLKAHLPGHGVVDVIASRPIEEVNERTMSPAGGQIMIPFANRMRGKFNESEKVIEVPVADKIAKLSARGPRGGAGGEAITMHGMMSNSPLGNVALNANTDEATFTAVLEPGDFDGHWFSETRLDFSATLDKDSFGFKIVATNTGDEPLPMGIGWHPYFALPSGNRNQAKLHIPAKKRAIVTNYKEMLPTGETPEVAGTEYDFSMPGGAPWGELSLDDCFLDLQRNAAGEAVVEVIDPEANYGLRIKAISKEIKAFMIYSPAKNPWVAVEPQFNLSDPYHPNWKGADTGMVLLQPGESATYSVELELFVP